MSFPHKIYISLLAAIVLAVLVFLGYSGYSYYRLPLEERFFHAGHLTLKPGGSWGHGFGIFGSLFMLLGVSLYMARKRMRSLSRFGVLKHWLEFHIFLCTLGPILVLYHTSFKFGGIVAVSFWSMVAVFVSGIIGRFIYIQIPRTIEGREMSLQEIRGLRSNLGENLLDKFRLDPESRDLIILSTGEHGSQKEAIPRGNMITRYFGDMKTVRRISKALRRNNLPAGERRKVLKLVQHDIALNRRIERLVLMQNLFRYWHVAHLPFALVMLIIMIIHVAVTLVFGYKWIF